MVSSIIRRTLASGASAVLLAAGAVPSEAHADTADGPAITQAVFFGDSLTDAGTYGFRFTTMPGRTWAQHVAERLGQSEEPNEHVTSYGDVYQGKPGLPGPGGLNYAEGGARANSAYSTVSDDPEGTPISTVVQVDRYMRQHGSFTPNQVVTLYVGTNDVAYDYDPTKNPELAQSLRDDVSAGEDVMVSARARVQTAAVDEAQTARTILDNGAHRLLVFKLFDTSLDPWFRTDAARRYVGELGAVYNQTLLASLPPDPRIQIVDTEAFVNDLLQNADRYGFTHGANEDACAKPDQDYCDASQMKSPDADRTYVFAAAEHMTTHANELLGEYVLRQIGLAE
ncbi:SGNH/GDSL hydrolase family protein [Mycobacterium yunnanensis]|uniref:SGNH/GDSL hydrolase family protein n=1 Tax=Mycobacterium yunnanensis TaxID=368477 RepID=A0A9X2Z2J7_9MYCO|nr:SGNH/GDSL hydrolase family protein [Mycobacterium yunnanensis]MCV7421710.1 SGNH/GDSL hydrolase family protein [Mycobacterium yunnanensis]